MFKNLKACRTRVFLTFLLFAFYILQVLGGRRVLSRVLFFLGGGVYLFMFYFLPVLEILIFFPSKILAI